MRRIDFNIESAHPFSCCGLTDPRCPLEQVSKHLHTVPKFCLKAPNYATRQKALRKGAAGAQSDLSAKAIIRATSFPLLTTRCRMAMPLVRVTKGLQLAVAGHLSCKAAGSSKGIEKGVGVSGGKL